MNRLAPLICPQRILLDLDVDTKEGAFVAAGQLFASHSGLPAAPLVEGLAAREKLGSTGIGQGIALPHARVKGLLEPLAAFLRLALPIAFDALDGKPVSELLVLLVPHKATESHLQLLAEAAQMFSDHHFRDRLRLQTDPAGVYQAFADWRTFPG